MGRRHVGLRYHPLNAMALCRKCHFFFTEHPFDFVDFCRERMGDDLVSELRQVASQPVKWTPAEKEEIYQFMKAEFAQQGEGEKFPQHPLMHVFGA